MWILNRLVPIALGTSPGGADGTEGAAQASWPRPSPAIPLSGVAAVKRARAVEPKAIKAGSPTWRAGARDAAGSMPSWSRRTLLQRGGAVAIASIAATVVGRALLERQRTPTTAAALPPPKSIPALPTGADLSIPGLTPIVMPNDKFYRIDTALIPPNVDVTTWKLKVTGMVDHPVELTYDELIQLPIIEQYVTIACVSNYVGGDLVGNTGLARRAAPNGARNGRRAGRGDAARRALHRRFHRRHADLVGHGRSARSDDRHRDERQAAAARARLPSEAHRARAVWLRLGHEVADGAPADDA